MSYAAGRHLDGNWDVVHGQSPVSALAIERVMRPERVKRRVYSFYSPAGLEIVANAAADGYARRFRSRAGGWVLTRVERRALAHADAIHVLSDYSARQIEEIHGQPARSKVIHIPWFVEPQAPASTDRAAARRSLGWSEEGFHAVTVRRLVPRMGVETLVRANGLLSDDANVWVHVIGDGAERGPLELLAQRRRRAGWIRFHGRLSDADLELAYAAADLFVLPTTALEGFGLIILEALAHGVPVIGTEVGAIPEILNRIEPGAIVGSGDPAALAARMDALAAEGVTRQQRTALAAKVRELFPRERTLDRFEAFLAGSPIASVRVAS